MKLQYVVFFLFFPISCFANEIIDTCWDGSGQNNFNMVFTGGNFTSGKAGATARFTYRGPRYSVSCWTDITWGIIATQTRTDLYSDGGYLKVNNDFDMRIYTIYGSETREVPTTSNAHSRSYILDKDKGLFNTNWNFPEKIEVVIRLRRDQLGGVLHIPPGIFLFRAHHSLYQHGTIKFSEVRNQTPIARFFTADQYIPLPVACQINNGMAIEVDFGDIDNTKISRDGSRYVKTVPLRYSCNTPVTQNININLVAAPASFSADVLASSLPDDIGVMVKYNGTLLKPNDKFDTTLVNGMGQDQLQVAPVINNSAKSVTGAFSASATLIMTLQ